MSLPHVNLDDRTFQDLVDEAKRLIPQLCPEWTNLGPADPGTAIIELFAWMSEAVIFRLNQVPDVFYTRMLNLIGLEPFPPRPARTELTFWLTEETTGQVRIPDGFEVATAFDEIVFATTVAVTTPSAELIATLRGDADGSLTNLDATSDVTFEATSAADTGERVDLVKADCFASTDPGACWYLGFDAPLTSGVIGLDVDCSADGMPGWAHDPPLAWEYWNGEGWSWAMLSRDDTHGLCKPGRITIHIGSTHEPSTLRGATACWLRARITPSPAYSPSYQSSPRFSKLTTSVLGGMAQAEHSTKMPGEVVGISNGEPGQRFVVRSHPVLPRRENETIHVFADGQYSAWIEVDDFLFSTADDPHFTWSSSTGEIRFGPRIHNSDGSVRQRGAIPRFGAEVTVTQYRTGGGAAGNVGARTLRKIRSAMPNVAAVENLMPASGGVDGETVENAKLRGPDILRRGHQLITSNDYERLVIESHPSIARVACSPPASPGDPVRVLVVPRTDIAPSEQMLDDFALPNPLVDRLIVDINERRVLGVTVEIGTPFYQGVSVAALLSARPGRPLEVVRARALESIYAFLNPVTGGQAGMGWPFGAELSSFMLFGLLESVEGVERVDEVLLFEYDLRSHLRTGFGKETIRLGADSLFLSSNNRVVVR